MDLILKLIDKLIELLKVRKKHNRTFFEDHIEPIYSMLRIVVDDYIQIFEGAKYQLQDDSINLPTIHKMLMSRRKKRELVRKELAKYSNAVFNSEGNDKIKEFAYLCWRLIILHPCYDGDSSYVICSQASSLIIEIEEAMKKKEKCQRDNLISSTESYIERTKGIWDRTKNIYFDLRTKMLK